MNAVLYFRFSPRPNGGEALSIETQRDRCSAQCLAKGWTILSEHEDRELSGGQASNRPGLQEALNQACEHKAVIVVYSLSRLARCTVDALQIVERLNKCGANLYSLHESIDTISAMGKFTFTLFAALAALEREQTVERTSDAMQRHQESGLLMTRPDRCPYGWKRSSTDPTRVEPCQEEAQVLQKMQQFEKLGFSVKAIAKLLENNGYTLRGSPTWHPTTVCRILQRERERVKA